MKTKDQLLQIYAESGTAIREIRSKYEGTTEEIPPAEMERYERASTDYLNARADLNLLRSMEEDSRRRDRPSGSGFHSGQTVTDETDPYVKATRAYLRGDTSQGSALRQFRASQQVNPNTAGGYLIATSVANEIIRPINNPIWFRQLARVQKVDTFIDVPKQTNRASALWQGETETATSTAVGSGSRAYRPNRLTVKTSNSRLLITMGAINVEAWLGDELQYADSLKEEQAYLTGDGVNKPLGVFTASSDGISTSRDVATATANTIVANDVLETFMAVKATVRNRAAWIANRAFLKKVMQMKDGQGQFIYADTPGIGNVLAVGTPMMLKGRPFYESEDAPSDMTTSGAYACVFGDFSHYRIYDFADLAIQVLDQDPYASNGELGYVMHRFEDGGPDLEEAFARMKVL